MKHDILSEIVVGETCIIDVVRSEKAIARRLVDMGFLPGVPVKCVHMAPSGSPIAFWVKGTLVALRRSDCKNIAVKGRAA